MAWRDYTLFCESHPDFIRLSGFPVVSKVIQRVQRGFADALSPHSPKQEWATITMFRAKIISSNLPLPAPCSWPHSGLSWCGRSQLCQQSRNCPGLSGSPPPAVPVHLCPPRSQKRGQSILRWFTDPRPCFSGWWLPIPLLTKRSMCLCCLWPRQWGCNQRHWGKRWNLHRNIAE